MKLQPWELGLCKLRAPDMSIVNAKVHAMLEEDRAALVEPRDERPGDDDPELRKAMIARLRKGKPAGDWLPLEVGREYRRLDGRRAMCDGMDGAWAVLGGVRVYARTGCIDEHEWFAWRIIGPWAPELEGKTPPKGFQWTGEYREPKKGEWITPEPDIGVPAWDFAQQTPCDFASGDTRWILIKL